MSRSKPKLTSPAVRTFKWNSEKAQIKYYDREQQQEIDVPLPFDFLLLDEVSAARGFSKDTGGIWSNQVRDASKDIIRVRNKEGVVDTGTWDEIKNRNRDVKFCNVAYIAFYDGGELKIGKLELTGAALSAWFDFKKGQDVYKQAVSVHDFKKDKTGTIEYTMPVFKLKEVKPETDQKAVELDQQLQEYLNQYMSAKGEDAKQRTEERPTPDDYKDEDFQEPENDLPI